MPNMLILYQTFKVLAPSDGGHDYQPKLNDLTDKCSFGCGAYIVYDLGVTGGPKEIDNYGKCPNNPENKDH